nr:hypothetical protein [Tanacetum cinerariifolium]
MSNINNNMQTQTSNSLHNAIMEAGSKDRPLMLAPGNYIQWKSRIKRYIDTKPNQEHLHYCLENPPYELDWKDKFINDAEGNPTTATHRVPQDYNTSSVVPCLFIHIMVNTRTNVVPAAAVQNALQTLLIQIRAEIREEFRTGSGPSGSGENPPPECLKREYHSILQTDTETSTEFMQRFLRLA